MAKRMGNTADGRGISGRGRPPPFNAGGCTSSRLRRTHPSYIRTIEALVNAVAAPVHKLEEVRPRARTGGSVRHVRVDLSATNGVLGHLTSRGLGLVVLEKSLPKCFSSLDLCIGRGWKREGNNFWRVKEGI